MASKPITISIQGDSSRLKKALGEAEKGVKGFAKNIGKMGARAGVAFGAVAGAVAVTGVQAASEFEKSMKEVLTLLPEAGAETFGELSNQVKNFSKEFGVLPKEVVPSLYQALSAGVPQDNVFEFLEVAQKAAKGGVTDLQTAVDGISSVVNSYGEDVISATEASDLMFTAVKLGKTDFTQLSASLFNVAPIAASMGIEFGEVTAALANLTAKGVPTSVAATQLKGAFAELGKEGTKASDMFKELSGKSMQDFLAEGHGLEGVLEVLKIGADDMGISLLDMFGSVEAGQAVLGLAGDGMGDFYDTMYEMNTAAGATEKAFSTMNTGMSADFEKIKANVEVMKIEIGEKLAPIVAKATQFMIDHFDDFKDIAQKVGDKVVEIAKTAFPIMVDVVKTVIRIFKEELMPVFEGTWNVVKKITEFVKENSKEFIFLASVIAGAVVAFGIFTAMKNVITFIKGIKTAIIGMNAAMAANPVGLLVVAIGALIAALIYAYTESEAFKNFIDSLFGFIKDTLEPVFWVLADTVKLAFEGIVYYAEYLWTQIKLMVDLVKAIFQGDFSEAWDILKDLVGNAIGMAVDVLLFFPKKIIDEVLPKLGSALVGLVDGPFKAFQTSVFGVTDKVLGFFKGLAATIGATASSFITAGKDLGKGLLDGMINGITAGASFTLGLAKDIVNAISGFINDNLIDPFNDLLEFNIPIPFAPDIRIDPPDIPRIKKLAKGGIVTGQQLALLGDNPSGTEAVIPLERAGDMGFGGTTININVQTGVGDPTKIGSEILSYLKQWERMNGSLPISVTS